MSSIQILNIVELFCNFPVIAYVVSFLQDIIISIVKTGPIPLHIAMVMDGNRTFAKKRNLTLKEGHSAGAESLVKVLSISYRLGIKYITIYAFSIENFNRSQDEVNTLFGLLRERLSYLSDNENSYTQLNKIKIKIVGNKSMIPPDILKDLEIIEAKTDLPTNERVLNVCFPYTSRDDIVSSIKKIGEQRINGDIGKGDIDYHLLNDNMLLGPDCPPLDIMIRTSGHTRLSDFMLWQCNYQCTIEFVKTLWPDFKFFGIILIILKWGYYKTLDTEMALTNKKSDIEEETQIRNILMELPPHPPYKSVTDRNI